MNSIKKEIYIVTGGPGFGKTSIIKELAKQGYKTGSEYAREIIEEQTKLNGEILPWKNIKAFQAEVLKKRIQFFESVNKNEMAFADRGVPDQLAFAKFRGFSPKLLQEKVKKYRYADFVFITMPSEKHFRQDHIRKESYEQAKKMHYAICTMYEKWGYVLVHVPFLDVNSRVKFIIDFVNKKQG